MAIENVFQKAFKSAYLQDKAEFLKANRHLTNNIIFQLSSFFGLPNGFKAPTWGKIAKKFIGLPPEKISTLNLLIRIIPIIFITIGHILQALSKTLLNTLKLVTEFLPTLLTLVVLSLMTAAVTEFELSRIKVPLIVIQTPLVLIFTIWAAVGSMVTSPFSTAYKVYNFINEDGDLRLPGMMAAAGSLLLSFILYCIFFPLAIQALAVNLPFFFLKIGSFVSTNLPWLANVAQAVVFSPILQGISHSLFYLVTMPAYAQGIAYLGIGVLAVGEVIQSAFNFISKTCWKKNPTKSARQSLITPPALNIDFSKLSQQPPFVVTPSTTQGTIDPSASHLPLHPSAPPEEGQNPVTTSSTSSSTVSPSLMKSNKDAGLINQSFYPPVNTQSDPKDRRRFNQMEGQPSSRGGDEICRAVPS